MKTHKAQSARDRHFLLFFSVSVLIPLLLTLILILRGDIPFWYDIARDMLSAWDSLAKPTLIGPTSGIPGIFYGPYWIWLLSVGLLISKDPRVSAVIVGLIPFFIIFPVVLFRLKNFFGGTITLSLWLLFAFSTGIGASTMLWNPRLSSLFFLSIIMILVAMQFWQWNKRYTLNVLSLGILSGLVINFHISFGIGVFAGTVLSLILLTFREKRGQDKTFYLYALSRTLTIFFIGLGVTFLPFLFFEVRHGFHQIQTAINALTTYGGVVALKGLTRIEILTYFFGNVGILLHLSRLMGILIGVVLVGLYGYSLMKKKKMLDSEKKLWIIVFSMSSGILFVYLTARNPVWDYHFIGTEVIFLLVLGLLIKRVSRGSWLLLSWSILASALVIISFIGQLSRNIYSSPNLVSKERSVDIIKNDVGGSPYSVFAYSPSIYQYEYTYLFRWRAAKDVPFDPGMISHSSSLVYLIIPRIDRTHELEFINSKTPVESYATGRIWELADGSKIVKRVMLDKK